VLSELVRANTYSHIISSLLSTFPNNLMEHDRPRASAVAARTGVRRAMLYMETHVQEPISVEDIAREARMSVRTLQYAFRSAMGVTPTEYLRSVRLAEAHRTLVTADPTEGATVSAIALHWGFAHPSRFAQQYRAAYGVSPKVTLDS
jgi:transcriptional regulator GlxA family with amidase domain